jgi:hypothetical protein
LIIKAVVKGLLTDLNPLAQVDNVNSEPPDLKSF